MSRSDDLPGSFRSLRRSFALAWRAEPRLLFASLGLALVMMVPIFFVGGREMRIDTGKLHFRD